jgi:hypothetical protein
MKDDIEQEIELAKLQGKSSSWAVRRFLHREWRQTFPLTDFHPLVEDHYDDFIDRLKGNEKIVAEFLIMGVPTKEIFKVVSKREFYDIKEALGWLISLTHN